MLVAAGEWVNTAMVRGNGEPKQSNKVVVIAASEETKGACRISEASLVLRGVAGVKRARFTVRISSLGIKEITFYLDGRKLKKLIAAQAKHGEFAVKVDPRKLRHGSHKITTRAVMSDAACPNFARTAVFVRAKPSRSRRK